MLVLLMLPGVGVVDDVDVGVVVNIDVDTDTDRFYIIIIDKLLYSAILWCTHTHCALQHSSAFSKFHKHKTYNYDN